MMLSYFTVPVWLMVVVCGAAIGGLLLMYRSGHNRTVLGLVLAEVWIFVSYLLSAFGVIGDAERIALLRSGILLLQFAMLIGVGVFIFKRGRRG